MTLAPGTKLGPYEILSPIGSGGMGDVWKARDTRLGRVVAIKKVKEQHSERFKQEAHAIATLNHPYICQLYDIGPDYLVLEYVEGKPLSSPLPEREAVHLAIQIATALEEAHQKGIIHRDLKPSNIMVTDKGSVKLLDFGLAKLYEQDTATSTSPTADLPATQAGAVLGTVAYMSPEQAQGQPADARSDIFSFGLVLYEMLSGRRAFSGDSNYAVMDAIVKRDAPPLQVSSSLEKIVKRCLVKQPSLRYQTISEVKTALEQVTEEIAFRSSEEAQPSIAVLPFVNMSGDKEQEYFSDGLAEEIINALTKIPRLKVTARTSSFFFRGKEADVREIGSRLNVAHILEGSVRKAGNRIRIAAQLINVADGFHIWSERFDRDITDVFAVQDEISQAIARKLRVHLSDGHTAIRRHTENVDAYNLYLKGRYYLNKFDQEAMAKGKQSIEQAIALDSNYALAWAGLADFYHRQGFFGLTSQALANEESRRAVLKALELDEMLPEAHAMMGVLRADDYDWQGAERAFCRALELDPKSEDAIWWYGAFCLSPLRRFDEAIDAWLKNLAWDSLSPTLHWWLGRGYMFARQWDNAIKQYRNALELDPQYLLAHYMLGYTYCLTGRFDEGIKALRVAEQIEGQNPYITGALGWAFAGSGQTVEAERLLEELEGRAREKYMASLPLAMIYIGLGKTDRAFDWLEKAVEERDAMIINILVVCLLFDPLRSHPRYHALLRKMNLDP